MLPDFSSRPLRSIKYFLEKVWAHFRRKRYPGSKRSNHPTPLVLERLSALTQGLLEDSNRVESNFFEAGQDLIKINEEASALGGYAREAVALVNGDSGLLYQIDQLVHGSMSHLQSCRNAVGNDLGRLAGGVGLMENLSGGSRVFDAMVLELYMIGVNIGVESVRTEEGQGLFGQLALDIRDLSKKIADIADSIHVDARNAGISQDKAYREITQDMSTMKGLSINAERSAREALEDIKSLMSLSASTMNVVEKHTGEIAERVGRIVEGIQFHDNMHQRIAHITQALAEIERFNGMVAQGVLLHQRMTDTFGHAASSLKKLSDATEQVRRINFEIHLMALNAIVRTAHLGSNGRALEVLAHAVKDLSDKIRTAQLVKSVSSTRSRLSFLVGLEDQLNRRLHELTSCLPLMNPTSGISEVIKDNDMDRFKARYTMEQERTIHENQTGNSLAPEATESDFTDEAERKISFIFPVPEKMSETGSTESELGDNVELFN